MKKKFYWICAAAAVALMPWLAWGNKALEVNTYSVTDSRIPEAFSGFRISQISDLHNTEFGKENHRLLTKLEETDPDIIVITGDMIDSRRTDIEAALRFAREAAQIAPCYYVPGNHESRISGYVHLKEGLEAAGVSVLENQQTVLERNGVSVTLMGIIDPAFSEGNDEMIVRQALKDMPTETYSILLTHRPELLTVYAEADIGLVFSGHAHGGQIRIPFVGGVLAPNQGFFPQHDSGLYTQGSTNMLVSRGLGNSVFPLRINNRPEIIVAVLQKTAV